MKKLWIYLPFLLVMACKGKDEKASNSPQPDAQPALVKSQNSEAFNASFQKMLNDYYNLKDGLVKSTKTADASVDAAANALVKSADSLKLTDLKADEAIVSTAKTFVDGISSETRGLLGEKDVENKRKSFQMISDNLYNLIRTVKFDKEVAYYQFCPMAFNDQGAYWLSRESDIRNPYFGSKMLTCGETRETLDFTPKQK
jgi:Cu(I)/Ag(I) efflux system membrane fusion protein